MYPTHDTNSLLSGDLPMARYTPGGGNHKSIPFVVYIQSSPWRLLLDTNSMKQRDRVKCC